MSTKRQRKRHARTEAGVQYTQHMWKEITFDGTEQDAEETITVHHDAHLVGILMTTSAVLTTSGNTACIELSDSGNFQGKDSDNANTLATQNLYAEGAQNWSQQTWIGGIKIPFIAGEKVYLNAQETNTKSAKVAVTLYWEGM